jgi:hypothetical protein
VLSHDGTLELTGQRESNSADNQVPSPDGYDFPCSNDGLTTGDYVVLLSLRRIERRCDSGCYRLCARSSEASSAM